MEGQVKWQRQTPCAARPPELQLALHRETTPPVVPASRLTDPKWRFDLGLQVVGAPILRLGLAVTQHEMGRHEAPKGV